MCFEVSIVCFKVMICEVTGFCSLSATKREHPHEIFHKKSTSESVLTVVAGPNYIDLIFLTFRLKFNYRKRTFRQKLLIKKNKGPYHRKAMAMLKYMGKTTSTTEINTQ